MDARTEEILNRFNDSWNETFATLDELIACHEDFRRLIPVKIFLEDIERKGGRNLYRLGTSIHTLIFSRSVKHGLRTDQKYISIETFTEGDFEVTMRNGDRIYRQYRVRELKDAKVVRLLQTLKSLLID